jgi:phytoene synthase
MRADPVLLASAYAAATEEVMRLDKDRFLASLFVQAGSRPHIHALLAFSAEIARVRDVVSNPLPGEIRLQWWRDLLAHPLATDTAAPPLAQALIDTITRFRLPVSAFQNLIDARVFDLYDDPMPSLNDLEGYLGETASSLFRLSSLILAGEGDAGPADLAGHAGVAYGLTGLLRAVPFHASKGQVYLPQDVLDRHGGAITDLIAGRTTPALSAALGELRSVACDHHARALGLLKTAPDAVRPAFLPLALVPAALKAMDVRDYDPFRTPVVVPQWRKQLALWWTARRF